MIDTKQAAALLDVSPRYIRTLVSRGKLRPEEQREPRGWLFLPATVQAYKDAPKARSPWHKENHKGRK